jgi:hypothetical protein
MVSLFRSPPPAEDALERPRLELSGPALTQALEGLAVSCEPYGGVERFVEAIKLRHQIIRDILVDDAAGAGDLDRFVAVMTLLPTVRRRVGPYLEDGRIDMLREATAALIRGSHDPAAVDERVSAFCARFPSDKRHRWVRDLAAEVLHAFDIERHPLMCRWVWDARANTGVLREIWHGDIDRITIPVGDGYGVFVMLREELSQFLSDNGVFRDVLCYVDLICAQVYANYISAQGGSYLRADFSSPEDPAAHLRRLLGLDGVRAKTTRAGDGSADRAAALLEGS